MNDINNDKRNDNWYTITEAEVILGVSKRTIQRRIKTGEVESKLDDGIRYVKLNLSDDIIGDNNSDTSLQMIKKLEQDNQELRQQLEYFQEQVLKLQDDLRRKDEQIAEASHRHDTVVMQMTKLLEYHQQPFWRKLFSRKALPPRVDESFMDAESSENSREEDTTSGPWHRK